MLTIPSDVQARGPVCVKLYRKSVKNGCSPRFAEMLALQQAPGINTDSTFMAGKKTIGQQCDNKGIQQTVKNARKLGYNPRPTDYYNPWVAKCSGDPAAFFNHGEGRGKLKQTLERFTKPLTEEPVKQVHRLHPRLVKRHMQRMIKENPDLARKDKRELAAEIVQKHGSPRKK